EVIRRADVTHPVAAFRYVADACCRAADGRALGVGGAARARPVAVLLEVAHACRRATRGAGGDEGVGGAVVAAAVAAVVHVADAGRGAADGRALRVGGTAGARPVAVLFEVADPRCEATRSAGSDEGVRRTVVADAVAAVVDVTDAGRGPAEGRALRIRRTGGAAAGAVLLQVTDT